MVQKAVARAAGASLTLVHAHPSARRKIPFITPSRCAASPIRMLMKCGSRKPVSRPSRKRNMPCHMRRRGVSSFEISFWGDGEFRGDGEKFYTSGVGADAGGLSVNSEGRRRDRPSFEERRGVD